ncbi:MAG: RES domain-containing protein, partial [Verrucomicrobiota bacterium]
NLDSPWGAYKEWNHSPFTCSPGGGRFHHPGELGLYAGSGQACCEIECRGNISGKLWVPTGPINLNAFDLPKFANDYGYNNLFLQLEGSGGYGATRFVKDWLHHYHNTSGILYESAQMAQRGDFGLCLALIPYPGQVVQPPFYVPLPTSYAITAGGILVSTTCFYP